jgi:hypothetical protein
VRYDDWNGRVIQEKLEYYLRDNQKPLIEEGHTTQWPKENTKVVLRCLKSKKDRQCNSEKKKGKRRNNDNEQ